MRFGEDFFERFGTVIVVSSDTSVKVLCKHIRSKTYLDLRLVLYTSGTTGTPKGVMLSDRNLVANAESIIKVLRITSGDKGALVISPHHAFGNSIINSHLVAGSSIKIGNMNFVDSVFNLIGSDVSIFYGVPSTYHILLKYPKRVKKTFKNLRTAASAGGGMDKATIKNHKGVNTFSGYSSNVWPD